jgi:hypothetical protein
LTQPTANPFALDERVNFMLFVTKRHLYNLRQLEDRTGSLAGDEVRNQAEIEINELLYHLVGVRDALLQEINTELNLGLPQRDGTLGVINNQRNQRGANARDMTRETDDTGYNPQNPLWLLVELHNRSEHRSLIVQDTVLVDGQLLRASLIDPRTDRVMRNDRGERILAINYLDDS